jgi:predicted GH43/DUF377 family glycosyl hydrolase
MRLERYDNNPIITPNEDHPWESLVTTNPGAWYDERDREVKLLYRAAGHDAEHVIHLGLATSKDGRKFERLTQPVFSPSADGFDAGCVEDPRIVRIGEYYYITYAARPFPPGQYWLHNGVLSQAPQCPAEFPSALGSNATSTGLALTKDFKHFIRAGRLTDPTTDDRDVILFPEKIGGRYFMLHRPMEWVGQEYGTEFPAIWIASGDDLLGMRETRLLAKAKYDWERKIGANTPPIRTEHGWLILYHGVAPDKHYRLGAMLLDLDDPTTVLHRTPRWIMQPEAEYELNGPYQGCIFPCGKVVIDGTLFVYYGAADKHVGLATCSVQELLEHLLSCPA